MSRKRKRTRGSVPKVLAESHDRNFNDLPQPVRQPQMDGRHQVSVVQNQYWQAPLPTPEMLRQFNEIIPDGAQRIMLMAEQEGVHTRHVQKVAVWGTFIGQTLGQIFAFSVAGGCIYAAFLLAMAGHTGVAGILGGGTVTTVVLAFLQGRKKPDPKK